MRNCLKVLSLLIISVFLLTACGDSDITEVSKSEILDTVQTVIKETEGSGKTFNEVKKLIATVIDYNNSQDKKVEVEYKSEAYTTTEQLTDVTNLLYDGSTYSIIVYKDTNSDLPTKIIINDEEFNDDLIQQNSVSDDLTYSE